MGIFAIHPEIHYGQNALEALKLKNLNKVCIATDEKILALGLVEPLKTLLDSWDVAYEIFSDIQPDPTTEVIEKGLLHIIKSRPDGLIAIGGGSVIDTAKAVIYHCIRFKETFVDPVSIHKPYFAVIPTTAGTGSEVTAYAVITNSKTHVKSALVDELMLPDMVVLDPVFTRSAPPFITAETGMDALTHAIEAYVASDANAFSDAYAVKAVSLIYQNLLATYKDGEQLAKREALQIASCMAGIAFNNAGLGICHSIAHTLGAHFRISHGRANAMVLPHVMQYNLKHSITLKRYAQLASAIGLEFKDEALNAQALIESVKMLSKSVGIEPKLSALGISHDDLLNQADSLAEEALRDRCTLGSPVHPTLEDLRGLFLKLL